VNRTVINFPHGLGDAVHFRLACELYRQKGYDIGVNAPDDKQIIFGPHFTTEPGLDLGWWQEDTNITNHETWQNGNKAFRAVNLHPLPRIDTTIEELAAVEIEINAGQQREAPTPRPYISMHPQGGPGGYWGSKSLNDGQIASLVHGLLERTSLDIVLLEWHNPYPTFSNERVWLEKRPPLARLANIIAHAELHIGVDSGPLYLSRLTNTPAVGLVPHPFHHPVIFTLPRPRATYVSVPTALSALFPDLYHVIESPALLNMEVVVKVANESLARL
jgi:ADP-heptose:LPS heptosyltransferase